MLSVCLFSWNLTSPTGSTRDTQSGFSKCVSGGDVGGSAACFKKCLEAWQEFPGLIKYKLLWWIVFKLLGKVWPFYIWLRPSHAHIKGIDPRRGAVGFWVGLWRVTERSGFILKELRCVLEFPWGHLPWKWNVPLLFKYIVKYSCG